MQYVLALEIPCSTKILLTLSVLAVMIDLYFIYDINLSKFEFFRQHVNYENIKSEETIFINEERREESNCKICNWLINLFSKKAYQKLFFTK